MTEKIVVGLSGGVDSSVAAALLHHQGYDVVGLTLWLMKGKGQCCSEGMVDAARICDQLGIHHEIVDSRDSFTESVINYLIAGYSAGNTPLTCSRCNKAVKFMPMLDYAQNHFGINLLATGHYARVNFDSDSGRHQLRRAIDRDKDQSYFLYEVGQTEFSRCVFPLGECTKAETRKIAAELGLATATKPESQDLCLVEAHGSMQDFLDQYIHKREGKIVNRAGKILGTHTGSHHYTIGQRKGLGVAAANPLYVLEIHAGKNEVVVGERSEAQDRECIIDQINWVALVPTNMPFRCEVQIRYRSAAEMATIIPIANNQARIIFDEPQFSITPGQAAVWYDQDVVLGGGLIVSVISELS